MRSRRAPLRGLAALALLCLLLAGVVALEVWRPATFVSRMRSPVDGATLDSRSGAEGSVETARYRPAGENAFAVIERRPLFAANRRPPEDEAPAPGDGSAPLSSLEGLVLTGIIGIGGERIAIVEPEVSTAQGEEPRVLRAGDVLRGWTVEAIEADRIFVANGTARRELELVDKLSRRQKAIPRRPNAPGAAAPPTPRQPAQPPSPGQPSTNR